MKKVIVIDNNGKEVKVDLKICSSPKSLSQNRNNYTR
jgi:hypothetical protein